MWPFQEEEEFPPPPPDWNSPPPMPDKHVCDEHEWPVIQFACHVLHTTDFYLYMVIHLVMIISLYACYRVVRCTWLRMRRFISWVVALFTPKQSPPMAMALPDVFRDSSPDADIDRFLRHLDLSLNNQICNKVDVLMTLLEERPRSMLITHEELYPSLTDDERYSNLKAVLRRVYQRKTPEIGIRESFWKRVQGSNEPAHQFAADLRFFAMQAFPEMDEQARENMIRRQFVDGLRNNVTSLKILQDNIAPMGVCVDIAENADDMAARIEDLRKSGRLIIHRIIQPLIFHPVNYTTKLRIKLDCRVTHNLKLRQTIHH